MLVALALGLGGCGELNSPNYIPVSIITITTTCKDAPVTVVLTNITRVIENAVAEVDGVSGVLSTSYNGYSSVTLNFADGYGVEMILENVRERIAHVSGQLPDTASVKIEKIVINSVIGSSDGPTTIWTTLFITPSLFKFKKAKTVTDEP